MTTDNSIAAEKTNSPDQKSIGNMTIANAKGIYKQFGTDLRIDIVSIVKLIRGSGIKLPLSNSNYLHALSYTDLMLAHTENEFRMLTGCAGGGFLECLLDRFDDMLQRLKTNGGKARIILVNSESRGPLDALKAKYPESLDFAEATASEDNKIRHFIVSDNDMVRDEEPHQKLNDLQSAEVIQAKVYFKNESKAAAMSQEFDAIWRHLRGTSNT